MDKKLAKLFTALTAFVLCLMIAGCGFFSFDVGSKADLPDSNDISSDITFEQQTTERTLYTDYSQVAGKVMRSVVSIKIEYSVDGNSGTAYGSGVIIEIDNNYYVVTCHHVISSMGDITVYIPDDNCRNIGDSDYNEEYALTGVIANERVLNEGNGVALIGGDKDSDIALLKLNLGDKPLNIVSAPIPTEGYSIQYAEKVFAIGNPSGELPMTFMGGNISYIDREINIDSIGEMTLLQHNVSINHGSSGGGLFNMYGELIGITNAGRDDYYNLNYAIPFNGANGFVNIIAQLYSTYNGMKNNFGYVSGRWMLGVVVTTTNLPMQGSYIGILSVETNGNSAGKLYANDRVLYVQFSVDGKEQIHSAKTNAEFAYALSQARKYFSSSATNPPTIKVVVYRPQVGETTVDIQLKEQYIFCDTGIYN